MWIRRVMALLLGLVAGVSACATGSSPQYGETRWADLGRACAPDAPTWGPPQWWRDSLAVLQARGPQPPDPDARMAALAPRIPGGYAALTFPGGYPVILLVDTTQRGAALTALDSLVHPRAPGNRPLDTASVQARAVRWDYATLYAWYTYLLQHGAGVKGLVFSDIQEEQDRILFGVRDDAARQRLAARLRELGIPCELVAVELTRPVIPL